MNNYRYPIVLIGGGILLILGIAVLTWINYFYISRIFDGQEFLKLWVGTRQFFMEGISPYEQVESASVLLPTIGIDRREIYFTYPLYALYFVAPFAILRDYSIAWASWMTILEMAIIAMVFIAVALTRWKIPIWMLSLLVLFSLLWYYAVLPVVMGSPSVLVAFFIAAAFLMIRQELDVVAGFLLAFSAIKIQMIILLVPFVLLWAISQRRYTIVWSFLGSVALMIIIGLLLVPDWILQYVREIFSMPRNTLPSTPGVIFAQWLPGVGKQIGWFLTLIFTILLLWEWRAAWKKGFKWFLWAACLTLVITNIIGFRIAAANYIAMYPALILVFALWDQRWGRTGQIFVVVSMLFLFFGLWWLFYNTVILTDQTIQNRILVFALPILLITGLYWVRWQAIRTPGPLLEEYRNANENGDI